MVLAAVQQNGFALQYASDTLLTDKEVVRPGAATEAGYQDYAAATAAGACIAHDLCDKASSTEGNCIIPMAWNDLAKMDLHRKVMLQTVKSLRQLHQ